MQQKLLPIVILILLMIILLSSCSPVHFEPLKTPEISYDKLHPYDVQTLVDSIPKPEKLEPIYTIINNDRIQVVTKESGRATHILLVPKEYAKVGALVKLSTTYKKIVIEQESLVNTYIDQINALQELIKLERQKAIMYRELWTQSENAYRQEVAEHKRDNWMNRTVMYIITIGSIVAIALAL